MQAALRKLRPKVARRVRPAAGAPPPDAPAGASDAGARPGGPTGFRLWREELCGVRETVGAGGGRAGDTAGRGGSGAAARRTETGPVRVGYLSADFGNHPTLDLLFAALARHAASDAGLEVGRRAPAALHRSRFGVSLDALSTRHPLPHLSPPSLACGVSPRLRAPRLSPPPPTPLSY